MPRRRAPTALRLHQGPMPSRDDPRHVLPQPPCPTRLAPVRPIIKIDFVSSSLNSSDDSSTGGTSGSVVVLPRIPLKAVDVNLLAVTKGPWDRSRSLSGAADGKGKEDKGRWMSPITPPKPVLPAPAPTVRAWLW